MQAQNLEHSIPIVGLQNTNLGDAGEPRLLGGGAERLKVQRESCTQRESGCCWNWELERLPCAGAQHVNVWLRHEQLRATAQDKYWVASSLGGQDHGVYNVQTCGG